MRLCMCKIDNFACIQASTICDIFNHRRFPFSLVLVPPISIHSKLCASRSRAPTFVWVRVIYKYIVFEFHRIARPIRVRMCLCACVWVKYVCQNFHQFLVLTTINIATIAHTLTLSYMYIRSQQRHTETFPQTHTHIHIAGRRVLR